MKFMLDKSTAAFAKEREEEQGAGEVFVPTAAQLEDIEAEGFETAKFVSHRTAGKVTREMLVTRPLPPPSFIEWLFHHYGILL